MPVEIAKPGSGPLGAVLLAHFAQHHPIDAGLMNSSGASAFVDLAVARAVYHGFLKPVEIVRYLDLMVVFGVGFDEDPQLPWAPEVLCSSSPSVRELLKAAVAYAGVSSGSGGEAYVRALVRARRLMESVVSAPCDDASAAAALLQRIQPEKLRLIEGRLGPLMSMARHLVRRRDSDAKRVRHLYVLLMFLLGSHFELDPRYSWAAEILGDMQHPEALRYQALYAAALTQVDRALAALRKSHKIDMEG
jgi:hypothetical protein